MPKAETVDAWYAATGDRAPALGALRAVLLEAGLEETLKWGSPCYTLDGKNLVGVSSFSTYLGLWFHQGVFLTDPDGVLVSGTEGATKAQRQWRFDPAAPVPVDRVAAYVRETVENHRRGKVLAPERGKAVVVPPELEEALAADPAALGAFAALTPGRQREYAEHVAQAKRSETRQQRAQKVLPQIRAGVGLNDRYRSC